MNLKEAIEKTQYVIDDYPQIYSDEVYNALRLGIEAMQFFKGAQYAAGGYYYLRLSGETED